jgi:parvulin-like peptidyl-prolyl isomerase
MNRRRVRRLALVAVAVACAFAAAGCSSNGSADAATVKYTDAKGEHVAHVKRDQFMQQLRDYVGNKELISAVSGNPQLRLAGDAKNTADPRFTAQLLGQDIAQAAFDAEFNERKLTITPEMRTQATQQVKQRYALQNELTTDPTTGQQQFVGPGAIFNAFPKSVQNRFVDQVARQLAVQDALQGCVSGRMVSHILLRDKGAADAAYEQIKKGADFATVAKNVSIDPSGQQGGLLGCLCPGEFVKEFQTVADKVPLDVVTVPVQSKFGYHLILVQKFNPALAQTNQSVAQSVQTCAQSAITDRLKHVTVDPRFGTWDVQNFTVVPPPVPQPRNNRGSTTTTTAAPAVPKQG